MIAEHLLVYYNVHQRLRLLTICDYFIFSSRVVLIVAIRKSAAFLNHPPPNSFLGGRVFTTGSTHIGNNLIHRRFVKPNIISAGKILDSGHRFFQCFNNWMGQAGPARLDHPMPAVGY